MGNLKKFALAVGLVLVSSLYNGTSAQTSIEENDIVRSALDEMFEDLDKSRVPTGYLLDYAVDLVELSDYDGTETLGLRRHGADRQQLCGPGTACGHIAECQVGICDSKLVGCHSLVGY